MDKQLFDEYKPRAAVDFCTESCGSGQKLRNRHVSQEAKNHGDPCPTADAVQTSFCQVADCFSGDCTSFDFLDWRDVGVYSTTCGKGFKRQERELSCCKNEGRRCSPRTRDVGIQGFSPHHNYRQRDFDQNLAETAVSRP